MEYKRIMAAFPAALLLLGLTASSTQAFAWGDYGGGGGTGYWNHWGQWGSGTGYWGATGCGYNCNGGGYWSGGGYHYSYTLGYQEGVQDAQAGNSYSCDGQQHSDSFCAGYGNGYYSVNQNTNTGNQVQGQEEEQQSGSISYSESNPHIVINNVIPQPRSYDMM